jgi:transposase
MSKQRLEHRHDDSLDRTADRKPDNLQRIEIITGVGRRRRFSRQIKARIVRESREPGAVISEIARRHDLGPQQLFAWRRELRAAIAGPDVPTAATSGFTPVVVEGSKQDQTATRAHPIAERGLIEITIGNVTIRLHDGVAPRMIAAVLQAVRARS